MTLLIVVVDLLPVRVNPASDYMNMGGFCPFAAYNIYNFHLLVDSSRENDMLYRVGELDKFQFNGL